jgi:hypothetical protein
MRDWLIDCPKKKMMRMPNMHTKTKTKRKLKTKQPKTKEAEVIQVNSIEEGKAVLVAIALERKLAQSQDKECKLPDVAVAVVPFHVGGALHKSAFARGHVIVEEDVKSVVNDHTMLCPLLKDLEERLDLAHMLRIDYMCSCMAAMMVMGITWSPSTPRNTSGFGMMSGGWPTQRLDGQGTMGG